VINSLAGSVRWVLDLLAWLTDTLLTLPSTLPPTIDLTKASSLPLPELLAHLHSTNTISLHLLLSSPTRGFLTAICRRLQHLDYIARKAIVYPGVNNTPNPQHANQNSQHQATAPSPALRAAYMQIATLTSNTILRIKTMETLLASLASLIKNAYASNNPPLSGSQPAEKARNALEIKMLFGGSFPDAFKSVIIELFKKEGLLDAVKEEIEPARLFFADFTMLEVDEDTVSVGKRKVLGKTMDCFQKRWLVNPEKKSAPSAAASAAATEGSSQTGNTNTALGTAQDGSAIGTGGLMGAGGRQGARWRRCARCAAVMEDVLTQRSALQWLVMQQRRCFCSGYWDTLAPGETLA
jgi:mediator of RNA polymerase II transcription subunit 16